MATEIDGWISQLERRHLADLQFAEVARALRALSSQYVERRSTLSRNRALDGAGKRAAFALYYGPLHFLAVERIAVELARGDPVSVARQTVNDLGCGTGAVGAALARATGASRVHGVDQHPWALDEARATYAAFGLTGSVARRDVARWPAPQRPAAIAAGYVVNELAGDERAMLLKTLVAAARRGSAIVIVEPLAHAITPWWDEWLDALAPHGARRDEWKLAIDPPPIVAKLGAAAGLTAAKVAAKTLSVGLGARQP